MKWEGVQVVAARVLGKWGGRRSVELLRNWLIGYYDRKSRNMGVERVASEALLACYEAQDVAWILDLYFSKPKKLYSYSLPLTLPIELVQDRILAESKHPEVAHRRAALEAIIRKDFPNRCNVLKQLTSDPNKTLSGEARAWLRLVCA